MDALNLILITLLGIEALPRFLRHLRRIWREAGTEEAAPRPGAAPSPTGEEIANLIRQMAPSRENLSRIAEALKAMRESLGEGREG